MGYQLFLTFLFQPLKFLDKRSIKMSEGHSDFSQPINMVCYYIAQTFPGDVVKTFFPTD